MLVKPDTVVSLKDFDPDDTGDYEESEAAEQELKDRVEELGELQALLYAENRRAMLIVLQGMDTSGKDGTIRNVMAGMSPLGVQVKAFKAPNEDELAHDFLWRVHRATPRKGYIGIFNRSHYEDVLVVRVHKLVPREVWEARFQQINQFEKMLTENNVIILKFFLHISKGEQKKRLEQRLLDPTRHWKFSMQDIEERRFWADYRKAYEDVLTRCSTKWAPWHIIPANRKWYRNLLVAQIIADTMKGLHLRYPKPSIDLSKVVVE
jgi:PPK2 family polyphosphate:nucleotide phosphotransferase